MTANRSTLLSRTELAALSLHPQCGASPLPSCLHDGNLQRPLARGVAHFGTRPALDHRRTHRVQGLRRAPLVRRRSREPSDDSHHPSSVRSAEPATPLVVVDRGHAPATLAAGTLPGGPQPEALRRVVRGRRQHDRLPAVPIGARAGDAARRSYTCAYRGRCRSRQDDTGGIDPAGTGNGARVVQGPRDCTGRSARAMGRRARCTLWNQHHHRDLALACAHGGRASVRREPVVPARYLHFVV